MVIKTVNLETVCGITSKIPDNLHVEFAFAGKSNVGKSSLINGLLNRKSLARVSAQPGKTRTINFYHVNDSMYFVDLPGYGYTNVGKEIKTDWGKMVERYLHQTKKLRAIFLLIDIRHEPSANDRQMYEWITAQGYHPVIVATKADKINRSQIPKHVTRIREGLQTEKDTLLIPYSALTKQGREEIYDLLEALLPVEKQEGKDVQIKGKDGNLL